MGRHELDGRSGRAIAVGGRTWARATVLVVAGAIVGAVVAGGVAVATIPSSTGGKVTACVKKIGGAVRIIDAQAGKTCASTETTVDWARLASRGAWSATASYKAGDLVTSGGSTYLAKKASKGQSVTSTASWGVLAARGATGATGATGAQGPAGATGQQGIPGSSSLTAASFATDRYLNVTTVPIVAIEAPVSKPGVYAVMATLTGWASSSTYVVCTLSTPGAHTALQGRSSVQSLTVTTTNLALVGHVELSEASTVQVVCTNSSTTWIMYSGNLELIETGPLAD